MQASARAGGRARAPHRRTRFGSWVRHYSVGRLLRDLEAIEGYRLTRPAIYQWLTGRTSPTGRRAHLISRLSRGKLTSDDVYRHREELARLAPRPGTCDGGAGHGPPAARRAWTR